MIGLGGAATKPPPSSPPPENTAGNPTEVEHGQALKATGASTGGGSLLTRSVGVDFHAGQYRNVLLRRE